MGVVVGSDLTALFLDYGRVCLSNNAAERACAASHWAENLGCSPVPTLDINLYYMINAREYFNTMTF
jgi:hypothetical protein